MKTHRDLKVWQNSIELVTEIYKLTKSFPSSETFGLASQIQRSAVSVPSNIAEGAARNSNKEFSRFLSIALGSLAELETQLIISKNIQYLSQDQFSAIHEKLIEIRKMINGLQKSITP